MVKLQKNLMERSNFVSYILFWWINDFFRKGSQKVLQESDMFELQKNDTSREICSRLERFWVEELKQKEPRLVRAIAKTYFWPWFGFGFITLLVEGLRTALPVVSAWLIRYFENAATTPSWHGYAYATAIMIISLLLTAFHHINFYHLQRIGWHLKAATCALMYKKTLRLSQKSLTETTTGQIVNLAATDIIRFDYLPMFLHYLWIGPMHVIAIVLILWQEIGVSILAGISVLIITMVLQSPMGKRFAKLRARTAILTDKRVRLMSEIINGMRIIKMYNWEKPFANLVSSTRRKEIRTILHSATLRAVNISLFFSQDKTLTFVTVLVYTLMGGEIAASTVFFILGIFVASSRSTGLFFNVGIQVTSESLISIKRIEKYLLLEEMNSVENDLEMEQSSVELKKFTGKWNMGEEYGSNFCLQHINVKLKAGKLFAVIGPVGAGKSSFIRAILKEMPLISGEVIVRGSTTFVNQTPWVFSGTLRENILFGSEFDPTWYQRVIESCSLVRDIKLLPNGDLTVVGERGVTLSGGQKARVNLARAVYRKDANICLLDDPLSAVDAKVANHIYRECIQGLMKDKTRILTTHQLQLLKDADHIIILKEGRIENQGTYEKLQNDGTDFAALLHRKETSSEQYIEQANGQFIVDSALLNRYSLVETSRDFSSLQRCETRRSTKSINSTISVEEIITDEFLQVEETEEMREQGSVNGSVYLEYFRVGANNISLLFFLFVTISSHILFVMNDWWLSQWTTNVQLLQNLKFQNASISIPNNTILEREDSFPTTLAIRNFDNLYHLWIYTAITLTMLAVMFLRTIVHFRLCVSSGIHMHKKMLRAILRSPIRFFDTNSVGRILNRFSKDMGQIDELLPLAFMDFLFISALILSIVILTSIFNYFVIIMVVPLVAYFVWLRIYYLKSSRDIKRLEGVTRSPVFSQLSSTLQGIETIRAFNVQKEFEEKFHKSQDLHSCAWYLFLCGTRWFGLRLDFIVTIFLSSVALFSVIAASVLQLNPGELGLILTYSSSMIALFQWGVRQSAEVENLMTSVERVQQYYHLPSEADEEIPENKPTADWPSQGAIEFQDVNFAYYEEGPTVLHHISFNIKSNEKVGIVGRTGAGKSSITAALFRLSELRDGHILIDGIQTSKLGLNDLRKSLSIIPQDPILFTGSMRRNLDPFAQYNDSDLWDTLEQVQLKETIQNLPNKLNTEVTESGSNFSVGQRQLVCLARALLRKSKILLIDEATANVDLRTDRLIQVTIREKFKNCTVLTIAHRINTIIDSDRVMVLDNGKLKEFDEPHLLLQKSEGFFIKMVNTTGDAESESLKKIARKIYKARHPDKA